ncbi:protein of unknown function DUF2828 [Macleaya cordata]|uniref:Uncharacterized protein n=1 Tax=Macleaya cordata TaxID=56857 RepID=A0A200R3W3_MACCD|nr:protein of unknown function DUF2828 [Macleaya cordata]
MSSSSSSSSSMADPTLRWTENGSATYNSTGNPSLDFFFHVVPNTPQEEVTHWLELAWKHDPLTALKLICHLRGVRGTGKSDKEGFYAAALWLHENHPKTLACNLKSFAQFGCFKDLPEILFRLLEGLEVRNVVKDERLMRSSRRWFVNKKGRCCFIDYRNEKETKQRIKSTVPQEERILAEMKRVELEKEQAKNLRKEKTMTKARKAMERYKQDPDYRFLHDRISELFAECLISDLQFLNSGELSKISFAAKWCPSLKSSFDKSTLLCESIARRVFPRHSYSEYKEIEEAHYAYRVRDRLRKEILVPLRKALELPEVYMGSNKWESLPYNRVASVAMRNYKMIFKKHDGERFKKYLKSVERGEAKISAGALLPHKIIASLGYQDDCDVAELQWRRMVEDLSKKGKLRDCLNICDVSRSMTGTPMEVCVALGLLVSDLCEDPWKGKVITFSTDPQLHKIEGDNLRSKAEFVKHMDWGGSTDFQKVFDQILQVAINGNLKEDQMIKRIFVFSDMEFDQASENDWETDYQAIQRKFRERGYMSVPEIVFWNLRNSMATPVVGEQKGVALVSGFSKNLLSLFLEGGDINDIKPIAVMERAIAGEEYNGLVVVDDSTRAACKIKPNGDSTNWIFVLMMRVMINCFLFAVQKIYPVFFRPSLGGYYRSGGCFGLFY